MKWYQGACPVCGGDLHDDIEDEGWLTCFLCARSFCTDAVLRGDHPLFAAWVAPATAAGRPATREPIHPRGALGKLAGVHAAL